MNSQMYQVLQSSVSIHLSLAGSIGWNREGGGGSGGGGRKKGSEGTSD